MPKLLVIVLLLGAGLASASDDQLRVLRNAKEVPATQAAHLIANTVALLQSCSIDSTAYAVTAHTWEEALRSPSHVLVTFGSSRKLDLAASQGPAARKIDAILLPLPENAWPVHLFVRSEGFVLSFTKYSPFVLKRIVQEPALELALKPPYNSLALIDDK